MKLDRVTFDPDGIETITVTMSLREATALHALTAALNGHAQRRLGLTDGESLYDEINGLFCRFYETGIPPLRYPDVYLPGLNDSP